MAERVGVRAAIAVAAYVVLHHLGSVPGGFGPVGVTRWGDWIDLLTPYVVVGAVAWTLVAARPGRRVWVLFGLGAITYVEGHGIHLAANSIGNVAPGPAAHLWDEVAGHAIWYAGVALLAVSLSLVLRELSPPTPRAALLTGPLALLAGLTWTTNVLGAGHLLVPGLVVAALLAGAGWWWRRSAAVHLLVAFGPAAIALAALAAV